MNITKITNRNTLFTTKENKDSDINMGVIHGNKHNFIVDTGIGGNCAKAILDYTGDDKKPIIVINTHHDWDHVAGNWVFEHCTIIAHKLCRELMDTHWDKHIHGAKERNAFILGELRKCLPNVLFEDSVYFPEDGIIIFHTPGHTPDSISVYDKVDKVLYVGDNFGAVNDKLMYWGWEAGDNTTHFRQRLGMENDYDFEICVFSHGGAQTKESLAELENECRDWMEKGCPGDE